MSILNVNTGAAAKAIHVQQIINWLRGIPAYSEPVAFTGISSPTNYALNVANIETSSGLGQGLRVWNSAISVPLLLVDHAGIQVRPNSIGQTYYFRVRNAANSADIFSVNEAGVSFGSGGAPVTVAGTQTLTNKTLTAAILTTPLIPDYEDFTQAAAPGTPGATHLFLYFKTGTTDLRYKSAGSGTELTIADTTSAQTISGKTLTTPTMNGAFVNDYADLNITTAPATPGASHIFLYGKTGTNDIRFKAAGSGTEHIVIDDASTQTLASKTMTTPILNGPVIGTGLTTDSFADFKQVGSAVAAPGVGIIRAYTKTGSTSLWVRTSASGELELVDTTSAQTISGKTFGAVSLTGPTLSNPLITNYEDFTQSAATPGTPGASKARLWAKTDNNMYINVGGIDQTILTSANTAISASTSLSRPLILGTL